MNGLRQVFRAGDGVQGQQEAGDCSTLRAIPMLVNRREAANLMLASPFNESVAFACLRLGDQLNYTLPREEALILSPRASVKRRTEFTLGRAAANLVVKQLVV